MEQFKKGDKVRRTHANVPAWRGMFEGAEAEVLAVNREGMVLNGWGDGHEPSYFELVAPAPQNFENFEIGDRVELNQPYGEWSVGQRGTVTGTGRNFYSPDEEGPLLTVKADRDIDGDTNMSAFAFRFNKVTQPEIKAGDTVTVERADWTAFGNKRKGYTLTGEVYGDDGELWVGPISLGVHDVTVIDHQPAPEPEPEWLPGMLVRATADGLENSELWRVMDPQKYGAEQRWIDRHGDPIPDSKVTEVRPLIVIDPATVDLQALGVVYKSNSVNGRWDSRALIAVLDALGIKVEDDSL